MVETTVELANKVGCAEIVGRIVDDLKDSKEDYRRMVMETIEKVRGMAWRGVGWHCIGWRACQGASLEALAVGLFAFVSPLPSHTRRW